MRRASDPPDRGRWRAPVLAVVVLVVGVFVAGALQDRGAGNEAGAGRGLVVRDVTIDEPINGETAAVRMVIDNSTGTNDRLVGVSSDAAGTATIHRSISDDQDRSTMEELVVVDIPAGEQVAFRAGGLHVMLGGLRQPMSVDDVVDLTLRFEERGSVTVDARVVPIGEVGSDGPDGESSGHDMSDMD